MNDITVINCNETSVTFTTNKLMSVWDWCYETYGWYNYKTVVSTHQTKITFNNLEDLSKFLLYWT